MAQTVMAPTMQETWVPFLGREDPLQEGMATHSRIFAWRIPCVCMCSVCMSYVFWCVCVNTWVCMCCCVLCPFDGVYVYLCVCVFPYICVCVCKSVYMCMCVSVYMCMCMCLYICV